MILALAILPIGMFVGAALDFSRHQSNSVELSASLDASALATALYVVDNPGVKEEAVKAFATNYLNTNFQTTDSKTLSDVAIEYVENEFVRVSARSEIETTMLSLAGVSKLKNMEAARASFGTPSALRAVLVLDNSESMDGEKMDALKEAAEDFVGSLTESNGGGSTSTASTDPRGSANAKVGGFAAAAASASSVGDDGDDDDGNDDDSGESTDGDSYIGIVPFSHYVNVGMDNKNASWISVPAKSSKSEKTCPADSAATVAAGCVLERYDCTEMKDGFEVPKRCARWVCPEGASVVYNCENVMKTREWCGAVISRAPPLNVTDADYDTDPIEGYLSPEKEKSKECGSPIMPMSSSTKDLENYIDDLDAAGDTYIAPGLMWGYRVLSPGAPFTEMAGKDIKSSSIVLMSDGMNSRSYKTWSGGSDHYGDDTKAANEDTLAACEFIKSQDVDIYAIAFQIDDKDTEDMLKECATSYSHYYDADSVDKLKKAFKDVAASFREVALTE